MNSWKVILATLVIFGTGVVTGGLLVSYAVRINSAQPAAKVAVQAGNPWQWRSSDLLRRMDRELELTADQHEHIDKIIANGQERTRALWKPIAPQMNKEMQRMRREIREELTADQQIKFDELSKPRQNKRPSSTNSPSDELTNPVSSSLISTNAAPANP